MTLAHARFWGEGAGAVPVACWVIGRFPAGVGGGDPKDCNSRMGPTLVLD